MTRKAGPGDDAGASLIFALILITVASVVIAVLLSFADSGLRAGPALRDQRTEAASADGAAQIAINELRHGTYDGTSAQCFTTGAGPSTTLTLPNFYQPPAGPADSAAVTCEPDPARAGGSPIAISAANKPANAILTLGRVVGEDGLYVNTVGARDLKVHGGVFSNSTINVALGSLTASASLTARGACTATITSNPAAVCALGAALDTRGDDPNYPAPTAATTAQAVPLCLANNTVVTFTPGLYTDITSLNLMARCANTILYFPPGTYYFNFPTAVPWLIDSASVVGGTPTTPLIAGTPPTMPGSCQSPMPPDPLPVGGWTPPGPNAGVQFVFGGGSQIVLRSSHAEICGSYSATAPPIAVYGLKTSVGPVPAESGCTIVTGYPLTGCAVIKAENQATSQLHVQGTTYVPNAALDIALNNPVGQVFSVGVIARTLRLSPTVGAGLTGPVIAVPDDVPLGLRTVVYLNVYVCAGVNTCTAATGTRRLRAKVALLDASGAPVAGARQIVVFSWSVLR